MSSNLTEMEPMILTDENTIGNEVQQHGFKWEKQLLQVYGATLEEITNINYTCPHDLPSHLNRLDGSNLSIKTTGKANTVCMADVCRVFDSVSSGEPIHVVVIHYVQKGHLKSIVSIVEMDLTNSKELLFGSLTRLHVEELDALVKLVPSKRKPTQEEKNTHKRLRDSLQAFSGAIYFNIKCNSTQSRVQCSFNQFQDFIKKNPERVVARSDSHEFRGGSIDPEIVSRRRIFKPKVEHLAHD